MSTIPDPIEAGLASGWQVIDASRMQADRTLEADVIIVGSGAGGGVTAETLALAGLKVIIVEEGMLKSSRDFKMREAQAYPSLYQESAARKTKDKAINILQGRTVGVGVRKLEVQLTVVEPPTVRPCRILMALSRVLRAADSWYRLG
jgi:malic enzyme